VLFFPNALILTNKGVPQDLSFANEPTISDKLIGMISGTSGVLLAALAGTFGTYCSLFVLNIWCWGVN
jgi:hypothetical protein